MLYTSQILSPDHNLLSGTSVQQVNGDPLPYVEKAHDMIRNKIMCVGTGLQEYYCVCAVIGLLRKKQSQDDAIHEEQKAAHRVHQMLQNVLSLQDNYSVAATLASLPTMVNIPHSVRNMYSLSLYSRSQQPLVYLAMAATMVTVIAMSTGLDQMAI